MGCFDTLCFQCPSCAEIISEQSKAGECSLSSYSLENAPLNIIADINYYGKKGQLYCEHCKVQLELEVRFIATPKIKDCDEEDDDWRTV